jgi:hypothetical protein
MTTRIDTAQPVQGVTTVGAGLSGASTGVKLSYTVPAGRQARISLISAANFNGAPTVQLRITVGGTTVVLSSGTVAQVSTGGVYLNAGDVADLNVSALVAATTFDGAIAAEEYAAQ